MNLRCIIALISIVFFPIFIQAQELKVMETHFQEGGYMYRFSNHEQLYKSKKNDIELKAGNENIPNEYVDALFKFTAQQIDQFWSLSSDEYGIGFLLNNDGQVVYVDIMALEDNERIMDLTQLKNLFNALCTWQKPFENPISDNPNGLYLISLHHSVFN